MCSIMFINLNAQAAAWICFVRSKQPEFFFFSLFRFLASVLALQSLFCVCYVTAAQSNE